VTLLVWWLLLAQVWFSFSENVCSNLIHCLYTKHQSVLWCELDTTIENVGQKMMLRGVNLIRVEKYPNRCRFKPFFNEAGGQCSCYFIVMLGDSSKAVYYCVCRLEKNQRCLLLIGRSFADPTSVFLNAGKVYSRDHAEIWSFSHWARMVKSTWAMVTL
jgi:hypothetical protein